VPLERVVNPKPTSRKDNGSNGRIEGPEAVLEVAADSVDALAAAAQAAYQAIVVNPRYKPYVKKSAEDFPAVLRGRAASQAV